MITETLNGIFTPGMSGQNKTSDQLENSATIPNTRSLLATKNDQNAQQLFPIPADFFNCFRTVATRRFLDRVPIVRLRKKRIEKKCSFAYLLCVISTVAYRSTVFHWDIALLGSGS